MQRRGRAFIAKADYVMCPRKYESHPMMRNLINDEHAQNFAANETVIDVLSRVGP